MRVEACDVVLAAERVVLEDLVGSVHGTAADDTESLRLSVIEKAHVQDWDILTGC